jgi:hypothetical protein
MSGPSASEQAEAVSQYKQRPIAGGKKSGMRGIGGTTRATFALGVVMFETLEAVGIRFIDEDERDGAGVRLRGAKRKR